MLQRILNNETMRDFFLVIIMALFIIGMASCSCAKMARKIERKCGKTAFMDTLRIKDTVRIASVRRDTIFKYFQRDTVIIREGRLTMKYFYNSTDSTVYLSGKCDTVFVIREIKAPYEKTVIHYDWVYENKWWLLLGIVALLVLMFFLRK